MLLNTLSTNVFEYCYLTLTIQLNISHLFTLSLNVKVLFDLYIGPYKVLPFRVRVDLGAMAMKGYSAFPQVPTLLEPHDQIV